MTPTVRAGAPRGAAMPPAARMMATPPIELRPWEEEAVIERLRQISTTLAWVAEMSGDRGWSPTMVSCLRDVTDDALQLLGRKGWEDWVGVVVGERRRMAAAARAGHLLSSEGR